MSKRRYSVKKTGAVKLGRKTVYLTCSFTHKGIILHGSQWPRKMKARLKIAIAEQEQQRKYVKAMKFGEHYGMSNESLKKALKL